MAMVTAMVTGPKMMLPKSMRHKLKLPAIWSIAALLSLISITGSLTASIQKSYPELGAKLQPWNGLALAAELDRTVKISIANSKAGFPKNMAGAIKSKAQVAFSKEPLAFDAIRDIALVEYSNGNDNKSRQLFLEVNKHTKRDSISQLWLMEDYSRAANLEKVLYQYDISLRANQAALEVLLPRLIATLEYRQAIKPLVKLLAQSPPWVGQFWVMAVDANTNLGNLAILRSAIFKLGIENPAGNDALLLSRLVDSGGFSFAEKLFLQLNGSRKSKSREAVNNNDFHADTMLSPFDWNVYSAANFGAYLDRQNRSLNISSVGNEGGVVARQLVHLTNKRYKLAAHIADETNQSFPPLDIQLACAEPADLAFVPVKLQLKEAKTDQQFQIDGARCEFFWLNVLVRAVDQPVSFDISFDRISLTPLE